MTTDVTEKGWEPDLPGLIDLAYLDDQEDWDNFNIEEQLMWFAAIVMFERALDVADTDPAHALLIWAAAKLIQPEGLELLWNTETHAPQWGYGG